MFDYHIHTRLSFDGTASPLSMVRAAEKAGLKEICFTDHADTDPLGEKLLGFEAEEYGKCFEELRETDSPVKVRLGAEIGAAPWKPQEYDRYAGMLDYDFIICSAHFVGDEDPYFAEYFEKRTRKQAFEEYFKEILKAADAHAEFDVFGHITYICKTKYCPYDEPIPKYSEFSDYYDEIFKSLIQKGKGIEVNTSAFAKTGEPTPHYELIGRYLSLGGEILTVGSDAHTPERVGDRVFETTEALKSLGVKYICTYNRRKPIFNRL